MRLLYKKKVFFIIVLIILIIFLLIFFSINNNYENFALNYNNKNENNILKKYENIPCNDKIYENIDILLSNNPNIKNDKYIIINFVNGDSGFGSQMTFFMQNKCYFYELNKNIICLPYFNKNGNNFKYHDERFNNSFFLYFKKKNDINNLSDYQIFFVNTNYINYDIVTFVIPIMSNTINKKFIENFKNDFNIIKNDEVIFKINNLKKEKKIFGIHIRSIAQKKTHNNEYLSISIEDRLRNLKKKIDSETENYNIFLATDVISYIELSKKIFDNIYYFDNVSRIDSEEDSIPNIDNNDIGYKLGSDILNECLALSLCDKIFISNSNIPFIISIIDSNIDMEEY